jgi:hypothetical protein
MQGKAFYLGNVGLTGSNRVNPFHNENRAV